MDEKDIERLLRQNLSIGSEGFRDALLRRCLDLLGSSEPNSSNRICEVLDEDLELLAAAGDAMFLESRQPLGDTSRSV